MTQASDLPASLLVETGWLAEHLDKVVLLDASVTRIEKPGGVTEFASGKTVFETEHLPGARLADLFGDFSDTKASLPFTRPSAATFEKAARALGINQDSAVVVYDRMGNAYAARVWLLFRSFGFDRVRVLNGGLRAWKIANLPVESGPETSINPGNFTAHDQEAGFVSTEEVLQIVEAGPDPKQPLICGLRRPQFTAEGSDDPRLGHIPGSLNLPFPDLLDADGKIDLSLLEDHLSALNLSPDATPVLYCGGGINASGLALALSASGRKDFHIYDDSMSGWTADPSRPVARGEGMSK